MTAAVVWFTGLSGSGKSSIAEWVAAELRARGLPVETLDGDVIRRVLPNTGFGKAERDAHVKRAGYLASRLEFHGVTVIASFVSPDRESRDFVRSLCRHFVEVHVATPLEECERRDAKGLYAKARRGDILGFAGITDPYEPPISPELVVDTSRMRIEEAGRRVLDVLGVPHRQTERA
jgi:adenylylsulfate kinase